MVTMRSMPLIRTDTSHAPGRGGRGGGEGCALLAEDDAVGNLVLVVIDTRRFRLRRESGE